MSKLWQKNSTDTHSDTAKQVEAFTVGDDYRLDQALVPFDLQASAVHAKALHKAGILTPEELEKLTEALSEIHTEWKQGKFEIRVEDEDMHTAIELSLVEKLGETGKKIHTGRSRNDQVLTAMRLYEKHFLNEILAELKICTSLLIEFGEKHQQLPMPGYTHTRKAMLSSVALWAGGYAEMLILQNESAEGVMSLVNRSPLGSAAGFGTTFDIDREFEAEELGFDGPLICSTTAQLSRGWTELQLVQFLAGITGVLNRMASDVIQFSSESTPFFDLDEVVCTGSSIMPQKKNPDVAELIRGGHADILGCAATLQSLTLNLGSGYHRDLQLSKEPVLKAVNKTLSLLKATQILVQHISPNEEGLERACSRELFAAETANKLVREERLSFREAYRLVGEHPERVPDIKASEMITEYSHLGSPGNPGLERLRKVL
jgi:argininosuccinate lyase